MKIELYKRILIGITCFNTIYFLFVFYFFIINEYFNSFGDNILCKFAEEFPIVGIHMILFIIFTMFIEVIFYLIKFFKDKKLKKLSMYLVTLYLLYILLLFIIIVMALDNP